MKNLLFVSLAANIVLFAVLVANGPERPQGGVSQILDAEQPPKVEVSIDPRPRFTAEERNRLIEIQRQREAREARWEQELREKRARLERERLEDRQRFEAMRDRRAEELCLQTQKRLDRERGVIRMNGYKDVCR